MQPVNQPNQPNQPNHLPPVATTLAQVKQERYAIEERMLRNADGLHDRWLQLALMQQLDENTDMLTIVIYGNDFEFDYDNPAVQELLATSEHGCPACPQCGCPVPNGQAGDLCSFCQGV